MNEAVDNEKNERDLTPEEMQQAIENFEKYQEEKLASKNKQVVMEEKKKEEEVKELQSDFKSFVENLPRKAKRNIFPQKKFGNQLADRFRAKQKEKYAVRGN